FRESLTNVAQYPVLEILHATTGVHQPAVGMTRDGVDGEIPALEIVFQSDIRTGIESETFVAPARFSFGARQGVFLFGARMQKNREVSPYRNEAARLHFCGCRSDHDPIAVARRQVEQFITNRTPNRVNIQALHHLIFPNQGNATLRLGEGETVPSLFLRDWGWPVNNVE